MKHTALVFQACLALAALVAGCGEADGPQKPANANPNPNAKGVVIGGYLFWLPSAWRGDTFTTAGGDGRISQLRIPRTAGDDADDLVLAGYLGSAADLDDDARLRRWAAEFDPPPGGPSDDRAKDITFAVGGCFVRLVEVAGTMHPAPARPGVPAPALPDWGMFVAVIQGGPSPVFLRITGPREAIESTREDVMRFLATCQKAEPAPRAPS